MFVVPVSLTLDCARCNDGGVGWGVVMVKNILTSLAHMYCMFQSKAQYITNALTLHMQ